MTQLVRTWGLLAAAALAAALAGAAQAQMKPGSQQGLGLTGRDIPPLLQQIKADPYRAPTEPACQTIPQEILALNEILGPDVEALKTRRGVGQMAAGYVRGLVPYRGVVRFLTRADSKDRELQAAATAGYARRGFLRGLEANLRCAAPPPGVPVNLVVASAAPSESAGGEELFKVMLTPAALPLETLTLASVPDNGH